MRDDLPSGTVTFLFTDVEGSTNLLQELGVEGYAEALAEHRRLLRNAFTHHGGVEVDTQGDSFFYAFPTAPGALDAAREGQEALGVGPIQVRVGIHTGTPLLAEEGYVGSDVHRAARIATAGHGGQILVSSSTAELVELEFADLGEHRLKDLSAPEHIYQLGEADFPPLKSLYRTNLPVPATPFLGRERELAEVVALLADTRLLTLTGPGGTGKTRLALQAVAAVADSFADGIFWVPLAALRDPELVLATASEALGARTGLSEHIQDKRLLVLFDNFEQVADSAPGLSDLLAACPNLELVITSREPLHLAGEQTYAVPSFVHEEAVGFFLARARAVKPEFESDDAVSEICRRLDDLPLALELAAARVKALSSAQILDRLEQTLPLLIRGSRDAPERQRTLRATIEWSYELLSEDEQRLFARLAVFRGGCTLEEAEEVCGGDLDTLQSLVEKSLLRFTNERYLMLETIREYAADALREAVDADDIIRGHAAYFRDLALEAEPELTGADQPAWFDRLDAEHDNLRAVLDRSLEEEGQAELGLRTLLALHHFWEARWNFRETFRYLTRYLAVEQPDELRARALRYVADLGLWLNDIDASERAAEESRKLSIALGDATGANRALARLGFVADARGDLDRARELFEEVLTTARESAGEDVAVTLRDLAIVAFKQGRLTDSDALLEEALAAAEERQDFGQVGFACLALAAIRVFQNHRADALPLLRRAFHIFDRLHFRGPLAIGFLVTAQASTDGRTAAQLLGKADRLYEEVGAPRRDPDLERLLRDVVIHFATDALGQKAFDVAYAEGRELTLEAAIALALEVIDAG